jgi:MFS transporter, ACS family, hexuronate transporter
MNRAFPGRYRWIICALLFLATTINYVDRQILSLLKPILDVQLGWTNEQFGMVNSAFQAAYAVGLLVFGWVIDRYGTKLGYTVSIAAWSLAALSHALVSTVSGFFVARFCLGLGEGGNFPCGVKVVAAWFPKKERAMATSIFIAGSNVGALISPAFVPWMALTWGCQGPFVAAGIAGLLWLFLWVPLYDLPTKLKGLEASELIWIHSDESLAQEEMSVPWLSLLNYRQTWSFLFAKMLTDPVWWFYLIWLPDYFNTARHLDIKHSWVHLFTIYSIVTVLSIAGSWFTGHLIQKGWSITLARKTGMFIFACCVLPVFLRRGWVIGRLCCLSGWLGLRVKHGRLIYIRRCPICFPNIRWPRSWASVVWPGLSPVFSFPIFLAGFWIPSRRPVTLREATRYFLAYAVWPTFVPLRSIIFLLQTLSSLETMVIKLFPSHGGNSPT